MSYPYLGDLLSDLFGVEIVLRLPMFGLILVLGVSLAFLVFKRDIIRQEEAGYLPQGVLSSRIVEYAFVTLFFGFLFARIFHILDNFGEFLDDPKRMIFSRGAFSMLGGTLAGTAASYFYFKRFRIPGRRAMDSMGIGLMIGYAVGRMGCQVSGDGDWGSPANLAAKPSWLPEWFWAQTYEGNIAGKFIPEPGVYPTPIYEFLICLLLFAVLWKLRAHRFAAGWLFALYFVLAGAERFMIEFIRVNPRTEFLGLELSQAQFISIGMMIAGVTGLAYTYLKREIRPT